MTAPESLDERYFDGIFNGDDDPWRLATSAYEDAKFARTIAALGDRRYARALEVGCAHGVLTTRLAPLCAHLLAIDISAAAIARARGRLIDRPGVALARMAFPHDTPRGRFDLIVLSEVVYYWSDADIARAAAWIGDALEAEGRVILVHWIGETDYPQTGDAAVAKLRAPLASVLSAEVTERTDAYRLDLWTRR